MKNLAFVTLGVVLGAALVVGAIAMKRYDPERWSPPPEPEYTQKELPDLPPQGEDHLSKVPPGKEVDMLPLPPKEAPEFVRDSDLVRQRLRPGKTYKTFLRGTLHTVGTDTAWGLESVVAINYVFESQVDREVVENDGQVIVEHRHFRDVRSLKIDTDIKDMRLNLGEAKAPILLALGAIYPPAPFLVAPLDGVSAAPVLRIFRALGIDPADITKLKPRVFKVFTQFDGLSGKSIKIVYWNKEERTGVIRLEPLVGEMTESEQFFHQHSAVLSDVLLFPEQKKVGESWLVKGHEFSNLIDPGLRASLRGELNLSRRANRLVDGKERYVLSVESGRLELESSNLAEGRLGWFEPRGDMLFSPQDEVIVKAELSGKGLLERLSRNHLLFKSEMKQSPELTVLYSCQVIDTPTPKGK